MSDTIQRKFIVLPSSGGVTDVAATAPIVSSGGATPNISITPGGTPGDTLIWDGSAWVVTMPGSGHTLVYTDLVPTSAQTSWFNNWTAMMAVYEALDEPKQIALWQTNPAVPLVAGVPVFPHALWWDVGCLVAVNPPGEPCSLALPDGAFIKGLHTVGSGVTIGTSGTQPAGLFWGLPSAGSRTVLVVEGGATLTTFSGTTPLIKRSETSATGNALYIELRDSSAIAAGPAPVLDVTPSGAWPSNVSILVFSGSTIGSGALSGADAAGGTATLSIIDYGGALVDLLQPSWTAAAKLWDWATFTVQVVPRVHVPVAPLTISYVLASGTEFVRVAPDGQTPIQITLLDPHLAAFQTVTVKKVNVDVNSTVTIVAADGSTIDGVLSYPLPATPYSVSHFTSDGSFWWGTS